MMDDLQTLMQSVSQGPVSAGPSAPLAPAQAQQPQGDDLQSLMRDTIAGKVKPAPPTQTPEGQGGWWANLKSGGLQSLAGGMRMSELSPAGAIASGAESLLGMQPARSNADVVQQMPAAQVQPKTFGEMVAKGVGAGAVGAIPGMGAAPVMSMLGGIGSGVASELAYQAAPDKWKETAANAAGLAGGMAIPAGAEAARAGGGLMLRKLGEAGFGPKTQFEGVRATNSQINMVGGRVGEAIGPEGKQVLARSSEAEAQAQGIEKQLQDTNLHPTDRANLEAQLNDLQGRRIQLVPGSQPTLAQLMPGNTGAADLEAGARVQNQAPFVQRAQEQNNARVTAVQGLAPPDANPPSFGMRVTQYLSNLERNYNARLGPMQQGIARNPVMNAGTGTTEDVGAMMRGGIQTSADPARRDYKAAWAQVDPDGTWAIQSEPMRANAADIADKTSPTAATDSQADKLLDRAQNLPRTIKFSDLSQMRADANDALRRISRANGADDPEVRRLTLFKQGIDATLARAIDDKAASDPATAARVNEWMSRNGNAGLLPPSAPNGATTGGNQNGPGSLGAVPAPGMAGTPSAPGAAGAGASGPNGASVRGVDQNVAPTPAGASGGRPGLGANPFYEPGDQPAPAPSRQAGRQPDSLVDFLIRQGGVKDPTGDIRAAGAADIHHRGGGRLVNPKGMEPDRATELARAAGFPFPENAAPRDLYDALRAHTSGQPMYRQSDLGSAMGRREAQGAGFDQQRLDDALYDARDRVNAWVEGSGAKLTRDEQDTAARLMVIHGLDPETAARSAGAPREAMALDRNAQFNAVAASPGMPLAEQPSLPTMGAAPAGGGGLTPNMAHPEVHAYLQALQQTQQYKARFGEGGVGKIMQRGQGGQPVVPEGRVPKQVFTGDATEPAEVRRLVGAVGQDQATNMGREALANELRTKRVISADGTINTPKFNDWLNNPNRKATLDLLPQLRDEFGSLRNAQDNFDRLTAQRLQTLDNFQKSAAAKFAGISEPQEIGKAIGAAFSKGPEAFRQMVNVARGDPDALAGLQKGVVDYIEQRHRSAVPSSDGFDFQNAASFRKFIDANKGSLRVIGGGQWIQTLEMVAADLRRQTEGAKAVQGSQTTPHAARAERQEGGKAHGLGVGGVSWLALAGEHLGQFLGAHSAVGAVATGGIGWLASRLRAMGINSRNELTQFVMLHPEIARDWVQRADAAQTASRLRARRLMAGVSTAIANDLNPRNEQKLQ